MCWRTVVGGILLSADQEFGVEELTEVASTDLINGLQSVSLMFPSLFQYPPISSVIKTYRRVKVDEDRSRHIFPIAGLGEEGLAGATVSDLFDSLLINSTVGLETVLEQVPETCEKGAGREGRNKKR